MFHEREQLLAWSLTVDSDPTPEGAVHRVHQYRRQKASNGQFFFSSASPPPLVTICVSRFSDAITRSDREKCSSLCPCWVVERFFLAFPGLPCCGKVWLPAEGQEVIMMILAFSGGTSGSGWGGDGDSVRLGNWIFCRDCGNLFNKHDWGYSTCLDSQSKRRQFASRFLIL